MNALVLEGSPHRVMTGWRHFQIIIKHDGGLKVSSVIGVNGSGEKFARDLSGKFFEVGTWEDESYSATSPKPAFAKPRHEILDDLFRERQGELKL